MTRRLKKYAFSEADINLPEVQRFYCGEDHWAREVAEWIRSPSGENSVLEDMRNYGTEVWLYRDEDGVLVGYSSLGEQRFTWPVKSKKKELVNVIPFFGIQEPFQGEPRNGPREERYAHQITEDLLASAAGKTDRYPLVVLSVDEENRRAIRFYEGWGFFNLKIPRVVEKKNVIYRRMARYLNDFMPAGAAPSLEQPK
jgi:hypothetical protein